MREAVEVVRELSRSAGRLHEAGLVHGDVRPENVRFSEDWPDVPILVGMRAEGDPPRRLTRESVRFFAPEQALTGEADARADVFSLATLLYLLVTGCMPVRDVGKELGQRAVLRGPSAQPLAEVRPDASKELCALVDRALSFRPADRPANGAELAAALAAVEGTLGPAGEEGPFPLAIDAAGRRALPRPPATLPVPPAAAARAPTAAEKEAWRAEEERVRLEYAKLLRRAEARLMAKGRRVAVTPEHEVALPVGGRITDGVWADVQSLENDSHPSPERVDEVGHRLAATIEAHVIASLRGGEEAQTGSRFVVHGQSGLSMWTRRYVRRFRPSGAVAARVELAVFVMCELLAAGYGYTHQVEDFQWQDATGYFALFRDIAESL